MYPLHFHGITIVADFIWDIGTVHIKCWTIETILDLRPTAQWSICKLHVWSNCETNGSLLPIIANILKGDAWKWSVDSLAHLNRSFKEEGLPRENKPAPKESHHQTPGDTSWEMYMWIYPTENSYNLMVMTKMYGSQMKRYLFCSLSLHRCYI